MRETSGTFFPLRVIRARTFHDRLLRAGYLFILPALAVYVVVVLYPTLSTIILSFCKWSGFTATREWVGLSNYVRLLHDELVLKALAHNLIWVVASVGLPLVIGVLLSVLMAEDIAGRNVYRVIFYLPMILPPVVSAVVWEWMYAPTIGLFNSFLRLAGLGALAQPWLGRPETALLSLIMIYTWTFFGFCIVITLAALQTVDPHLKEAGRIDGAGAARILFAITLPSIRNELGFLVMFMSITALKVFNLPYIITGGGPANATEVVATVMYQKAFGEGQMGYGAAIATVLLLIVTAAYLLSRLRARKD